jgi:ABC-type antimicrobial peptide transport system permease subunit
MLSIAVDPAAMNTIPTAIASIWKKYDVVHPIELTTMEKDIDNTYIETGYTDIVKIIGYISFLAITLASLGMLGMVMYSTQLKIKEVGVRKVLGASVKDLTVLLSRSFVILIAISVLIGVPLGYILGNFFLQNFAFRISNTWCIGFAGNNYSRCYRFYNDLFSNNKSGDVKSCEVIENGVSIDAIPVMLGKKFKN